MALTVSYPGVYVQEIGAPPPDVGVTTSLAAFIGRAPMGPVDTPVTVNNWGDYHRVFGGLDGDSSMSYQVSAFFENGGGQAVCVRLFEAPAGGDTDGCRATLSLGAGPAGDGAPLVLAAASPGSWGDRLSATVDTAGVTEETARGLGVSDPAGLFNLTVACEAPNGAVRSERFANVTLDPAYPALLLRHVLTEQSQLVTWRSGGAVAAGATGQGQGGRDSAPLSIGAWLGDPVRKTGLYALDQTPGFNILCIPPDDVDGDTPPVVYQRAAEYCVMRNAMLIIDPPTRWQADYARGELQAVSPADLGAFSVEAGRSSAVYFPRVQAVDPLRDGQVRTFPNSGYMAGVWAQTDVQSGVWKAPAGLNAAINGVAGLPAVLTDAENGLLNPLGVNCLRTFPIGGTVIWGARTLQGADVLGDPYAYIPVRRLMLYLTEWTLQNTKWAVFEPNDEVLWAGLRSQVSAFMNDLWKQGALFGSASNQAWFVSCDATTTSTADIEAGRVNIQIGFAPVRPAEFVILNIQQTAGQG
jgi:phage tail sheath protein FI